MYSHLYGSVGDIRPVSVVSPADRGRLLAQEPFVLWLTGLSGAGKSTLAQEVARCLHDGGYHTCVLDGDDLRSGLNRDLGFSLEDRRENVRRVAEVAALMYGSGLIVLVACISPLRAKREFARGLLPPGKFVEVLVDTSLAVCEQRDSKGLYRRARAGQLPNFTGIASPFERSAHPEMVIDAGCLPLDRCVETVMAYLDGHGLLGVAAAGDGLHSTWKASAVHGGGLVE